MGATARFSISSTVSGLPEGGSGESGFASTFSSTNAHWTWSEVEVTTNGSTVYMSRGVVVPSSATAVYVKPTKTTNGSTAIVRVVETTSTNAPGVRLGYRGPSMWNVESTVESTIYFISTAATTFRVRVGVL